MTYNNMGQALQEENALDEALAWYQRALRARSRLGTHSTATSPASLPRRRSTTRPWPLPPGPASSTRPTPRPTAASAACGTSRGTSRRRRPTIARPCALKPDLPAAHAALGTVREELGDFAEAESCWRTALRHDPRHAAAHAQLATMLRAKLPDEDLAALRQLLADPDLPDGRRCALQFGLAQVHDARGDYDEAAESLRQANALALAVARKRGQDYDPAEHARFVDGMMAICTPAFFERVRGIGLETRAADLHRRAAALRHDADRADPGEPFAGVRGRRAAPRPATTSRRWPPSERSGAWRPSPAWTRQRPAASASAIWSGSRN